MVHFWITGLPPSVIYWFPRAGVGTHSGRASVQSVWVTRRWRVVNAFPRQRVGTREINEINELISESDDLAVLFQAIKIPND
jgi:hypothetical protein